MMKTELNDIPLDKVKVCLSEGIEWILMEMYLNKDISEEIFNKYKKIL